MDKQCVNTTSVKCVIICCSISIIILSAAVDMYLRVNLTIYTGSTYIHVHIYIYMYIFTHMYVCIGSLSCIISSNDFQTSLLSPIFDFGAT